LLLELTNRVSMHDRAVRDGEWSACPDFCFWKAPLVELSGKTMSVIGFGRIGRRVGELAHAFGMSVLAYDPLHTASPAYRPFSWASLDDAFSTGDVVSLNCPLTPENEGMVDAGRLGAMKGTAILINASRGPLVVEQDLASALCAGAIAGAGVDVAASEPLPASSPLLSAPNCLITPHIAWASLESRKRLMQTTVENITCFLAGSPQNVVN
jgi:glycerate dehydrogenase